MGSITQNSIFKKEEEDKENSPPPPTKPVIERPTEPPVLMRSRGF